ncbi:IS110 family transposase [Paenibacillus xylanexedens]|uniref:IS110 family transposase n=1 Tax=Paenibacillus xylanexedens TaxID=528191 RepID=UPI0011A7BF0A|nr:IS110 family transposase [Paenibacillus xylanexedens]
MQPVVGVDVAKGSSVVQAFRTRNEPFGKAVDIVHEKSGFEQFSRILDGLQAETGLAPVIVLEATGHYHRALVSYLERSGYTYYIVNPLQSKRAKGTQLRKVKTDAVDAWHLAEMYYRGDVKPHRTWEETFTELQHLTRQHEFVTGIFVQAKLNSRALLEQVFPAYEGLFSNVFSATSLMVLARCLEGSTADWIEVIQGNTGRSRSRMWASEKNDKLKEMLGDWKEARHSQSQSQALLGMVKLLLTMIEQLDELEQQMEEVAAGLPEVELVKSIPGIGTKLAAAIVAEMGDIRQFSDAKQLVAFAGLDPGIFSSGKFTATNTRITKRGSKRLRRSLYLAVQCGIRKNANARIGSYYEKKRKEGKPYKVVVIACANKLLHHIFAILQKGLPYQV